ncbi:hypothetical protein SAMN04489761_4274 [Tenacibaculum sp. MAR_2009_124]|uniref:hypothetical protein n=1 Tax=Tenacibaculum sp. MAR_2009_124 TaxID=1250059 RepID=UPI00089767E1|nr:hypothetical protein [Tenacibaculum sp. MAR_2009_124]SED10053.1 hypothetical protein SAMN04489761_4274 [Tenacibaculum sp. MAR_2009_124]
MEDELILSEGHRSKLDGILNEMIKNKESEKDINFVVEDYKKKYGVPKVEDSVTNESSQEKNHRLMKKNLPSYSESIDKYNKETQLTPDDRKSISDGVQKDIEGKGLWNTVKKGAKTWWNNVFDEEGLKVDTDPLAQSKEEVINHLKERKELDKYSEVQITDKTKELEILKRETAKQEKKKQEYIENIPESEKTFLSVYQNFERKSFNREDKRLLTEQELLRGKLTSLASDINEIGKRRKEGNNSEELERELVQKNQEYLKTLNETKDNFIKYSDNREKLGSAADNLDLFKRDYGFFTNFTENLRATTADLIGGGVGSLAYLTEMKEMSEGAQHKYAPLKKKILSYSDYFKKDAETIRKGVKRPFSVENVESMTDFGNWFMNTVVAQQLPILAVTSTGIGGVGYIGASSIGNKYGEMTQEGNYSSMEKMLVPFAYGGAEAVGSLVDLSIMKNAGRVINSATKVERKSIAQGMFNRTKEYAKDSFKMTSFEMAEESGTQFFQNVLDKYALGKKEVHLSDGIKDALASSGVLGMSMASGSHGIKLLKETIRPFLNKESKLNSIIEEISVLEKELNESDNIPEDIQDKLKNKIDKKKSSLQDNFNEVSDSVSNLSDENYNEVLKKEKEKEQIIQDLDKVKNNDQISENVQKILIKDSKEDFRKLEEEQKEILTTPLKKEEGLGSDQIKETSKSSTLKLSEKGKTYNVVFNEEGLSITGTNKEQISQPTFRKVRDKYAESLDFTQGEIANAMQNEDYHKGIAESSLNPSEVAESLLSIRNTSFIENNIDYKQRIIAENIGFIDRDQFIKFGDENLINQSLAKSYLRKDGKAIDVLTQELSEDHNIQVSEQDIIDFIVDNPNGKEEVYRKLKNEHFKPLENKFSELTGLPANDKYLEMAINQKIKKENDSHLIDNLSDDQILELANEYLDFNNNFYNGKTNTQQSNDSEVKIGFTSEAKGEPETKGENGIAKEEKEDGRGGITHTLETWDKKLKEIDDYLKKSGSETLGMNMPIVVARGMIQAMRLAVKTAKTGLDIIEAGRKYVASTDWYKNLNEKDKTNVLSVLNDENTVFNNLDKIVDDVVQREKKKSDIRAEKLKQTTKRLRKKYSDVIDYKNALIKNIRERIDSETISNLTKTDISTILHNMNKANSFKRVDALTEKVDYILSLGEYRSIDKKLTNLLKIPRKFLKSINGKPKAAKVDNETRKLFNKVFRYLKETKESNTLHSLDLDKKINNGDVSDKTLDEKVVIETVIKIQEAEELFELSKKTENKKNNKENAERIQIASHLKENVFYDLETLLNEGKYKLKELLFEESIRLKGLSDAFIEATNHKWNDINSNNQKAFESYKKKNSILGRVFEKSKNIKSFFTQPVTNSFEYLLGYFDQINDHGDGDIYKHFYSGENGIVQLDENFKKDQKEIKEDVKNAFEKVLGKKLNSLLRTHKYDKTINRPQKTDIKLLINGKRNEAIEKLSIGQALYIHLVSKMEVGRGKLIKQGWDELAFDNLNKFLGKEYVELSDFMTNYLKEKYEKYNKVYNKLLRTDLNFEEGYFPLKYRKENLNIIIALGESNFTLPNVSSSHLKNRIKNNNEIDTNTNAFDVFDGYLNSMERFYHYGRFTKDLNAILSNRKISRNLETLDKRSFDDFKKLSKAVIGDVSEIRADQDEHKIYKFNSAIAAGYIGYKGYTALKQFLSMPAYTEKADDLTISLNGSQIRLPFVGKIVFGSKMLVNLNPVSVLSSYKFLKKNSSHFRDRISKGTIGDEFIDSLFNQKSKLLYQKALKKITKLGITPNKFIDAITISTGGKVYYDQQYKKYLKSGVKEKQAHRKAIRDFEIGFKLSQQSSDASDLSIIQHGRGVLTILFVPFKNSQFSYFRRISANSNNILRRYRKFKETQLSKGAGESKASLIALAKIAKEGDTFRDLENVLLYTHILPMLWQYVASGVPGVLTEWDEDDTDEMIRSGVLGLFDGVFILNDVLKWGYNSAVLDKNWNYQTTIVFSEMETIFKDIKKTYEESGEVNEDILFELLKGYLKTKSINTDTFKNIYDGVESMILEGDYNQENLMKLLNAPKELKEGNKEKMDRNKSLGFV